MPEAMTAVAIGRALVRDFFRRRVLAVPNCSWPGDECDMLIVTPDLRLIDVEVKTSRADLRREVGKDKWWEGSPWRGDRARRDWPRRTWKHYIAAPADVAAGAADLMPSPASGLLSLRARKSGTIDVGVIRRATPNGKADRLSAEDAIDIARLAGLRMWDALDAAQGTK